jgi:formylglycine-generating enzyme required for sulfatase activity
VRIRKPAKPVTLGLAKVADDEPYFRAAAGRRCCATAFDIQEHEVTWAAYEAWAKGHPARVVKPPPHIAAAAEARRNLPVVGVSWTQAKTYCESLEGTLPNEAQHEYAARGPTLKPNPWGAGPVDLLRTSLLMGRSPRLRAVCSADQDVIRHDGHRVCDLGANALEWALGPYLHPVRPDNPPDGFPFGGLQSRRWRAVRGLPLLLESDRIPRAASAYRAPGCVSMETCSEPERRTQLQYTGFRCVRPVP